MNKQHWRTSRRIVERIVIQGDLELLTPAHFGAGDAEGVADLTLLRDGYEQRALLPGASIAGALRAYWDTRMRGYGAAAEDCALFGAQRGARDQMEGEQSLLIVEDALGPLPQIELREGVKIAGATRTAEEKKLFDMEVLRAGTKFRLRFELLVNDPKPSDLTWEAYDTMPPDVHAARIAQQRQSLCQDLVTALAGFAETVPGAGGDITLGARKRRGFGLCRVEQWRVWRYDLAESEGLLAWLTADREGAGWEQWQCVTEASGATLAEQLGVSPAALMDARRRFTLQATLALESSLLVRSGSAESDGGPDTAHLHRQPYTEPGDSRPAPKSEPILPGTSLAGVLRARALRIANTLAPHDAVGAQKLVNALFGVGPEDTPPASKGEDADHWASRLVTREAVITGAHSLVQTRIRVDRFTGGAMDNYLFNEAPVFGGGQGQVALNLELRDPERYEIGLVLLLLKDLWTGDLPVGGGSGIGRGRLRGMTATLTYTQPQQPGATWELTQTATGLQVTGATRQTLEDFVTDLNRHLAGEVRDGA